MCDKVTDADREKKIIKVSTRLSTALEYMFLIVLFCGFFSRATRFQIGIQRKWMV